MTALTQPTNLFGQPLGPGAEARAPQRRLPEGPFAAVALEQHIDRALDYAVPPRLRGLIRVGQRVRVPLGKSDKKSFGFVVALRPSLDAAAASKRIKEVRDIEDERVLVPDRLMELSRWISRYYVAPLGTTLDSVIPSAVKKRIGVERVQRVRLLASRESAQATLETTKAPKRRAILARLLQLEPGASIDLPRLATESGATPPTVRKLVRLGLISVSAELDLGNFATGTDDPDFGAEPEIALNDDQRRAMESLRPRLAGGFSVSLLMGVTGSGKTEVYLQCIREAVNAGRQAIVLVPEIALTPQTVRRFTARFKQVAILHSGLSGAERHRHWQAIATGRAQVVVGARSAIFAPLPRLGVIVVDEEHEASYKQDTAPRYHARDVAVKRAQLEGIPVILGSATPSLESYYKAGAGETPAPAAGGLASAAGPAPGKSPYLLVRLPNRVRGLAMPHVELIDMKRESRARRGVHLLSQRLEFLLRTTVDSGRQAILLLNRRGYSNFVYCPSCTHVMQCKYCDATMTYHRSAGERPNSASNAASLHSGQLHCHYCLAVNPLPPACPECGKRLSLFGLGTQRVEEEIARKFPELKYARVDGDTMRSGKDYEALLARFARGEIQALLGTQMIAKGLDYPNVTLVGVISGDTALALPDFRAAERTFQLITQVAGRAGRGDAPGRVVLQTLLPDDLAIQAALSHDFARFARTELASRREVGLPPITRMARIILRDQEQPKLHQTGETLAAQLADAVAREGGLVRVRGPMPCAISRIAGYYRDQIVLYADSAPPLQRVLAATRASGAMARNDKIAVDVDPVSLL